MIAGVEGMFSTFAVGAVAVGAAALGASVFDVGQVLSPVEHPVLGASVGAGGCVVVVLLVH